MSQSIDLTTQYLGLTLKNPLIASASPVNTKVDHLKKLEAAGIAAVVLPSLFQEQIEQLAHELEALNHYNSPEADAYLPATHLDGPYGVGPDEYLILIKQAKEQLSIPVIASLNGYTNEGWVDYAWQMEAAGADALELNIYQVPTDIDQTATHIEEGYIELVRAVRAEVKIPLSIKLCPYFTSLGNFANNLAKVGADGLVIFNRIMHPDINTEKLQLDSGFSLSHANEMNLALQWIGLIAQRINVSLAASTGVENSEQVIKYLLAGADCVMTTSALLRNGPDYAKVLLDGLCAWLKAHKQTSLTLMRGQMSWQKLKNNQAYERSLYIKAVGSYKKRH